MGSFLGHFKASGCSQSSASSYHPQQSWQKRVPVKTPKHHAQPQLSHVSWAVQSANAGTTALRLRLLLPLTAPQLPWQKRTGTGEQGEFLNQHSSLLLTWTSTYSSLDAGDRGSWRNRNSAGRHVKVVTFWRSQQDSAEDLYDNPWRHLIQCLWLFS